MQQRLDTKWFVSVGTTEMAFIRMHQQGITNSV